MVTIMAMDQTVLIIGGKLDLSMGCGGAMAGTFACMAYVATGSLVVGLLVGIGLGCVDTLYTVGGSSKVAFLNQMISSALNITLLTGPQEASSVGNILLQAVGSGELSCEEEVREVVCRTIPSSIFYPENPQEWDRHYPAFF